VVYLYHDQSKVANSNITSYTSELPAILKLLEYVKKNVISYSLNDLSWSQVKVRLDNGEEFFLRQFRCTVIEYGDRQGFGDADRVRHLDQAPPAKTSFDQGLGDPASRVCRRPVHFGEVFSGECAAPVGAPPAVRVHDDLATGQTGIALQQTKRRSIRHVEEIR
jgi:hypothetical protein